MSEPISARPARFQGNVNNWITVILGFAIFFMVNYLGYRYYERKDLSQSRYYELSPKTIGLLNKLDSPVRITTYLASSELKGEIENLIKEYQFRGGKNIQVERIDPYLDMDRAEALQKKFNFGKDENLVIFEYKDRSKYISDSQLADYDNSGAMMGRPPRLVAFKGEQQFTATIQSLMEGKPAKIYFLTGHGERELENLTSPSGYGELETRIKRENIECATLNLATVQELPKDADAVVIAGPKQPLSTTEVQAISNYLDQKGKVILLQDPETVSGLETLAEKFGIKIQNDWVVARSRLLGTDVLVGPLGQTFADHPAVKALRSYTLQMSSARSVSASTTADKAVSSKVTELVKTPQGFWGETNLTDRKPQYDPNTDIAGPLCLAAVYDGGDIPNEGVSVAGTRFMVVGGSLFLANQNLDGVGVDFFSNSLNWMLKKEIAIGISPKVPQEYALNLSEPQLRTMYGLSMGAIPLVALVMGLFVWYSRRK